MLTIGSEPPTHATMKIMLEKYKKNKKFDHKLYFVLNGNARLWWIVLNHRRK